MSFSNNQTMDDGKAEEQWTQILIDSIGKIIWIRHDYGASKDSYEHIGVPENVNIFKLLSLEQPKNVTDIYDWKVSISPENQLYPNISHVLEASRNVNSILKSVFASF